MNSRFIILLCLIAIAIFAELLRYFPINKRCKNCKFYNKRQINKFGCHKCDYFKSYTKCSDFCSFWRSKK